MNRLKTVNYKLKWTAIRPWKAGQTWRDLRFRHSACKEGSYGNRWAGLPFPALIQFLCALGLLPVVLGIEPSIPTSCMNAPTNYGRHPQLPLHTLLYMKVLLNCWGWPWICNPPASSSWEVEINGPLLPGVTYSIFSSSLHLSRVLYISWQGRPLSSFKCHTFWVIKHSYLPTYQTICITLRKSTTGEGFSA